MDIQPKQASISVKANGCVFFALKSAFTSPTDPSVASEEKAKSLLKSRSNIKSTSSKTIITKPPADEPRKIIKERKNFYQAELELICGFYHGNQTVLVVLTNLNSPSFAFTSEYNDASHSFNIFNYEDLSLD
jgi:hypothetical protein